MLAATALAMALAMSGAAAAPPATDEARTASYLDRIADDPPRLRMFLQTMPKGGDLHNHLGGGVYAEDILRWAADDGLCIATDTHHIVEPPCDAPQRIPARGLERNYAAYGRTIDTLSARGFEAHVGDPMVAGYDRFFSTFDGFGPVWAPNVGKAIGIARRQAADDHIAYLELMTLPQAGAGFYAGVASLGDTDFATLAAGIAPLLPAAIAKARADFDRFEAEALAANDCAGTAPAAACRVTVRYQVAALRNLPPAQVFAQLSFGFALAEADPRFVGVNIVAPEHDPLSIRDYDLHMRMLAFLKARHPAVALSLHAGELTLGLVPPPDLSDHISKAVAAGARRIGHGVDIAYERDAAALLKRMARDRIAVEINLTSNAVILGVKGKDHPLSLYRAFGVPIVLATDDQGVSRSDMTNEYLRAVTEQHLRYHDLKQAARDALEYAFLPGASLWRNGTGGAKVLACAGPAAAPACQAFLGKNLKAKLQWQLEQDFSAFERTQPPQRP